MNQVASSGSKIASRVTLVQAPVLLGLDWVRHGFSTRSGGRSQVYGPDELNLGFTAEDDPARVSGNRQLLASVVAAGGSMALLTLRQVHGVEIRVVASETTGLTTAEGRGALEADGWMTHLPGVLLGIQTADCVPVLLADRRLRVVAALHAGWRGTAAGISELAVKRMATEYGSEPPDIVAAIGPGIGPCCYRVGHQVVDQFRRRWSYADGLMQPIEASDEVYIDLPEANRRQLAEAGVRNVDVVGECTGCSVDETGRRRYFSHRIDRGVTGRLMSVIGIAT